MAPVISTLCIHKIPTYKLMEIVYTDKDRCPAYVITSGYDKMDDLEYTLVIYIDQQEEMIRDANLVRAESYKVTREVYKHHIKEPALDMIHRRVQQDVNIRGSNTGDGHVMLIYKSCYLKDVLGHRVCNKWDDPSEHVLSYTEYMGQGDDNSICIVDETQSSGWSVDSDKTEDITDMLETVSDLITVSDDVLAQLTSTPVPSTSTDNVWLSVDKSDNKLTRTQCKTKNKGKKITGADKLIRVQERSARRLYNKQYTIYKNYIKDLIKVTVPDSVEIREIKVHEILNTYLHHHHDVTSTLIDEAM